MVDADQALRRERAKARSGLTDEEIRQRMAYQMPAAEKKKRADFVIDNNGDWVDFKRRAKELGRVLKKRQGKKMAGPGGGGRAGGEKAKTDGNNRSRVILLCLFHIQRAIIYVMMKPWKN